MSNVSPNCGKLEISLRENGEHSFFHGFDCFAEYGSRQDKMVLRDAIMFLHHGIELLMKHILAEHSEFLIFQDLGDAARKQRKADESGVALFFLPRPPKTVSYLEAINRVSAFVKPPDLSRDLQRDLEQLNQLRNQVEHYAIEADIEDLSELLNRLHDPLMDLFEAQIGGIREAQTPQMARVWREVKIFAELSAKQEREAVLVLNRLEGQEVPGRLLGRDGQVRFPEFLDWEVDKDLEQTPWEPPRPDIVWIAPVEVWLVEVRRSGASRQSLERLRMYRNYKVHQEGSAEEVPISMWLVVFGPVSQELREACSTAGIMVTGEGEWEELLALVMSSAELVLYKAGRLSQ